MSSTHSNIHVFISSKHSKNTNPNAHKVDSSKKNGIQIDMKLYKQLMHEFQIELHNLQINWYLIILA